MQSKERKRLKSLLEAKYQLYHRESFIENDPILIPHLFSLKEDIEITGFLAATIAWGQRTTIIKNARRILDLMDNAPHSFITQHQESDLKRALGFVHRTFNADDLSYYFQALQYLYIKENGLEGLFSGEESMAQRISQAKSTFFSLPHLKRSEKHFADPLKGSTAKRINMFLRWMVRPANGGPDFGIWESISPRELMMPLDVHTAAIGRKLGLLQRKQNDWKAVEELTASLRLFDPEDPVRFDFALFGIGVNEGH
jgi:uncharacterized protein (TIGR02757 family)